MKAIPNISTHICFSSTEGDFHPNSESDTILKYEKLTPNHDHRGNGWYQFLKLLSFVSCNPDPLISGESKSAQQGAVRRKKAPQASALATALQPLENSYNLTLLVHWHQKLCLPYKQARKLSRCDSNLRNLKILPTHPLTYWLTEWGRC